MKVWLFLSKFLLSAKLGTNYQRSIWRYTDLKMSKVHQNTGYHHSCQKLRLTWWPYEVGSVQSSVPTSETTNQLQRIESGLPLSINSKGQIKPHQCQGTHQSDTFLGAERSLQNSSSNIRLTAHTLESPRSLGKIPLDSRNFQEAELILTYSYFYSYFLLISHL